MLKGKNVLTIVSFGITVVGLVLDVIKGTVDAKVEQKLINEAAEKAVVEALKKRGEP